MVEMLNIPQIYGTQYHDHQIHHEYHTRNNKSVNNQILCEKSNGEFKNTKKYQSLTSNTKTISSLTDTTSTSKTNDNQNIKRGGGGGAALLTDIYASLSSLQSIKSPTHYIEKLINLDLFKNYERLKLNNKYLPHSSVRSKTISYNSINKKTQLQEKQSNFSSHPEDNLRELNCLQDKHRNHIDTNVELYEAVRFNAQKQLNRTTISTTKTTVNMINKCSRNFLAETANSPGAATLQNFQKLPECDQDFPKDIASSGPSSSTSDINSDNPILRHLQMSTSPNKRNPIERITKNGSVRIYVDACPTYSKPPQNSNESVSTKDGHF